MPFALSSCHRTSGYVNVTSSQSTLSTVFIYNLYNTVLDVTYASRWKSVSLKCLSEVGGWQRTCGVSEVQRLPWSVPCQSHRSRWRGIVSRIQAILPKPGKRLMYHKVGKKIRLDMEARMSIKCRAVAMSHLDSLAASACAQRVCFVV